MKQNLLILLFFFLLQISFPAWANEPDSAYVFAYTTEEGRRFNGLYFAWSVDGEDWHPVGSEYKFLKSDYGRDKTIIQPALWRDSQGVWHCMWSLSERKEGVAHVTSTDLVKWGRQAYHVEDSTPLREIYSRESAGKKTVEIKGKTRTGKQYKVEWSLIDGLIRATQMVAYKDRLQRETSREDAVRFASLQTVEAEIAIHATESKKISDLLIGVFFEDLNYAADGGIYAELVQNRGFEYALSDKEGKDKTWDKYKAWKLRGEGISWEIDSVAPVHANNQYYIRLKVEKQGAALLNEGFAGIPIKQGERYDFSAFIRMPEAKNGKILIRLTGEGGENYGEATVKSVGKDWKKQEVVVTANQTVDHALLEIIPQQTGQIDMDMISLFPQKTFKGRKNGLRADLAQTIADMQPRFVRFPGGCLAHGDGLGNMYHWKNTVGTLESRKPQRNIWNYHQTVGLGYFEYFQFCEDIGAEPLPVVPAGVPCQNSHGGQQGGVPMEQMDDYIQEILDMIAWANGNPKTNEWAKRRAEAGHPKPFGLKYIGIGNEDQITDVFEERFTMIYRALQEKHPEITVIGTTGPFSEGTDYEEGWELATQLNVPIVDEHYYQPSGWFIHNQDFYDRYDRNKSKVYVGEYAARAPGGPNLESALAEALYLTNVERNGDVVSMTSYAPLLAKEGFTQWNPDLIYFTNTEIKPTIGYYVQKLYGKNSGDEYLSTATTVKGQNDAVKKRFAVSTVRDSRTGDLVVKMVNMLPVSVVPIVSIEGYDLEDVTVIKQELKGDLADKVALPVESSCSVEEMQKGELAPYSFTVYRIKQGNRSK